MSTSTSTNTISEDGRYIPAADGRSGAAKAMAVPAGVDVVMVLHQVLAICQMAQQVDPAGVSALLRQFAREETLGPILTPSAFMATADKALNARRAVTAFDAFRKVLGDIEIDEAGRLAGVMAADGGKAEPLVVTGPGDGCRQEFYGDGLLD